MGAHSSRDMYMTHTYIYIDIHVKFKKCFTNKASIPLPFPKALMPGMSSENALCAVILFFVENHIE